MRGGPDNETFETVANVSQYDALRHWLGQVNPAEVLSSALALTDADAWFAVDSERHIVWWSDGAKALLGFSRDEVLGEHCLRGNRCHACMHGCGIAEQSVLRDAPLVMIDHAGREVAVKKSGRAFFDEAGRFVGGIEVLRRAGNRPRQAKAGRPPLALAPPGDDVTNFFGLLTRDHAMREAILVLKNVAESDVTVLIRGESGTGKELVARGLHAESRRRRGPFVAVNCAALSPTLLESELFGHERGAFTGAVSRHLGVFEQAHGGTLFLDEVAELPIELQAKLLRALQERTFQRVGGKKSIHVDVRIVSATNRSLRAQVAAGAFREDLMYRLRVVPVFLPPLRQRRSDIRLLTATFLEEMNARGAHRIERIAPDAQRAMLDHPWPGNVRELQNVLEYAIAVGRGPELMLSDLPPEFRDPKPQTASQASPPTPDATPPPVVRRRQRRRCRAPASPQVEAINIAKALDAANGDIGAAAEALGMSRASLWRKRKRYGIAV